MITLLFSAPWCQQCKTLKKIFNNLDVQYTEINVDDNPEKSKQYKIKALPTVVFESDSKKYLGNFVGLSSQAQIKEKIQKAKDIE